MTAPRQSDRTVPPSPGLRALLVGEVVTYVGALIVYANRGLSPRGTVRWGDVVFYLLAGCVPIALNLLHGDRPADSGIRLDTLRPAARQAGWATGVMAGFVIAVGLVSGGFHWKGWDAFGELFGLYLLWGPVQQYLLQAFALRRLRQAGLPVRAAIVAAAGLFALVHLPNWPLVALTAGAGVVWCALFLRHPNLLALGLAHAVLAILLYHAWPVEWLDGLAIGRMYGG